ncbi:hypothetical protein [Agromyces sp. PvR057]|uniref:hypothetical protein n=1 Tax=Agromyces sp. PvR057 TaxID=3156403 RepID=UPI003393A38E
MSIHSARRSAAAFASRATVAILTLGVVTFGFLSPAHAGETDTTPPTVTIEQSPGQADPTSTSPIRFDIVYSEPVVDAGIVLMLGTAGAHTAVTQAGPGTTFTVEVSGMTSSGTVLVSIAEGSTTDLAGNPNLISTSVDNVVDYLLPGALTLVPPADQTVATAPGAAGANVTFAAPTVVNGVEPMTVGCDHESGAFYPIGVTSVTCQVSDSSDGPGEGGGFASASFEITVTATPGVTPAAGGAAPGGAAPAAPATGATGQLAESGPEAVTLLAAGILLMLFGAVAVSRAMALRSGRATD